VSPADATDVLGLLVLLPTMQTPLAAELRLRSLLLGAPVGQGQLEEAAGCLPSEELVLPAEEVT
jgi:UPF0716 family protein affecting phage T7 exclusion